MDVIEQAAGVVTILEPRGRIDSVTAKEFGDRLSKLLDAGRNQLVIDLHSITYISSAGFRQLLIAKRSTQNKNGKIAHYGVSGEVNRKIDMNAFDKQMP